MRLGKKYFAQKCGLVRPKRGLSLLLTIVSVKRPGKDVDG